MPIPDYLASEKVSVMEYQRIVEKKSFMAISNRQLLPNEPNHLNWKQAALDSRGWPQCP